MNNVIWKKYNLKTKLRVGDWVEIINRETEKAEQHQITNINPNNQGILECNDLIIDTNSVTRYGVVEPLWQVILLFICDLLRLFQELMR